MKKITITSGMNGYPAGLRDGYVYFESFEEAERFAKDNNGEIVHLRKRNGWHFYESVGRAFEPFELTAEDVSSECDGGVMLTAAEAAYWAAEERQMVEDNAECDEWPDAVKQAALQTIAKTEREIQALPATQQALVINQEVADIYDIRVMSYYYDVWENVIGVEIDNW